MRYKILNKNNKVIAIGTDCGGTEITEAEYNALLTEIRTKADLADNLYNGEITAEDVPAEWREEIQRRVDERIAREAEEEEELEATETDYQNALREMGVEV